jgi:murein DD-endopeptidase MepM/ murein hydrolase activator NlpD
LFRVAIPIFAVRLLAVVLAVGAIATGYLLIDRNRRITDQKKLASLQRDNSILRSRMDFFAAGVDSLRAELRRLQELDAQVRLAANLPVISRDVRAMGIGGGTVGSNDPGAPLQNNIDWLLEQARFQRSSFYAIASNLEKQSALQSGTPSIMPTSGWITSSFGWRRDPFTGRNNQHEGMDIVGIPGQAIVATAGGTVVLAGRYQNWGNVVEIDHGRGIHSFYAHNATVKVKDGDKVKRGQAIATLGSTGRSTGFHCHYGIKLNGNWVDPRKYILSDQTFYD